MFGLREQQQEAFEKIQSFIQDDSKSVFILKGYAGTGKTTMIRAIIPELGKYGKFVCLMAPTGRAAKLLREKTEHEATTIHKCIYQFDGLSGVRHDENGVKIEGELNPTLRADGVDDIQLNFEISPLPNLITPDRLVCIVDESSMISYNKVSGEIMHCGTDVLLDDLLTYGDPHKGAKFVFVGDPAQLPPVGDSRSAALDESYFMEKGLNVESFELTQVLRQSEGSVILANAMKIRDLLNSTERSELLFDRVDGEVVDVSSQQIVGDFIESFPTPQLGASVVICYSNAMVRDYNESIRGHYYDDITVPHVGDVLQVVKNNYVNDLYNGDFVQIVHVSDKIDIQSAPVWTSVGLERKRITVELRFRDVVVQAYDGRELHCKIVETLLGNSNPMLTPQETTALYINFRMRHPECKTKAEIRMGLNGDLYFNALCVKYGYAITCHKAQGGEWLKVYVDYHGRTGLDDDSLRWAYTATTRAEKILCGVAMPNMQLLDKLQINPITKVVKPQKNCINVVKMGSVSNLPSTATDIQKAKYLSVSTELNSLHCQVSRVEFYSYVDRYFVQAPDGERVYNLQYNGDGVYSSVKPMASYENDDQIQNALKSECEYRYNVQYETDVNSLMKLYNMMQSCCDELGIAITNITEAAYQLVYHLKTSGSFSAIQFFYNARKVISYAVPMSDIGTDDEKLVQLIEMLSNRQ